MRELVAPSAKERPRPRALGKLNRESFFAPPMKCDQGLQLRLLTAAFDTSRHLAALHPVAIGGEA